MPFLKNNLNRRTTIQEVQAVNTFTTQVYGWMTIGLVLTAVIAWAVYYTGLFVKLMPIWWLLGIANFGVALLIQRGLRQNSAFSSLMSLFLTYAGIEGLFFGTLLPVYAASFGGQVIWMAFASAALVFGIALGYGILTKSDLTGVGKILSIACMGLIGITLVYFILSFFMSIPAFTLIISYIGIVIFVGLTAYEAQQIRKMSRQVDGFSSQSCKLALLMALQMYVNVIMIFWYLLQILSNSSSRR